MSRATDLLREQLEQIEDLKHPPVYHPRYMIWKDTTLRIIKENFNENYAGMFDNPGPHQIAADEEEHYEFFLYAINEQKQLIEAIIEESERFAGSADVDISKVLSLKDYDLHLKIKNVSLKLFEDKHFAQSVEEAFKCVIKEVKTIVATETSEDLDGDRLMNRAFGFEKQNPIIKFNLFQTPEDKDEQKGIMYLFKGIVGIRNKKAHTNVLLDDPNRAIEYLCLSSLLMRLLDQFAQQRD